MKKSNVKILTNKKIAKDVFEMKVQIPREDLPEGGSLEELIRPGQFINIRLLGEYLRRPISICDWTEDTIIIIYKVVGRGTERMSCMAAGQMLDILWPLGNGFRVSAGGGAGAPVLTSGGVGTPPMYSLCRRLVDEGKEPVVILGFRSAEDVFYQDKFEALGVRTIITTEDGSAGVKGFVTDVLKQMQPEEIYACGPEAMLRAIDSTAAEGIPGQFSFEERMGCGFGACMGCSCRTKYGSKRICKDGPVLERSEIIW